MLLARQFGCIIRPVFSPTNNVSLFGLHARRFSTYGWICQEHKGSSWNKNPEFDKTSNKPWLEAHWNIVKSKIEETRNVVNKYAKQLQYHSGKAREAIREANKKIAEQERDRSNQKLNYNKDVENDGQIHGLPSEREIHRRKWSRKLEFYLDSLQETIFTATRALNDVTGYSSIQKLRKSIELMEGTLEKTRNELKLLKDDYAIAIEERTRSQRELNELLQRKNIWTPEELEKFTQLYKNDAMNLKKERELKGKVNSMESKQEELNDDLYRAILTRYHEEQIWSDKIRRTSTWGTFLLMIVNIVLFLVFQLLLEPWKRRRLTSSFEDKVKQALNQYAGEQNMALKDLSATMNEKKGNHEVVSAEGPEDATTIPTTKEISTSTAESIYEKACKFYRTAKAFYGYIWHHIKVGVARFDPSDALNLHSEKTLTHLQLYTYSFFLFIGGTVISRII